MTARAEHGRGLIRPRRRERTLLLSPNFWTDLLRTELDYFGLGHRAARVAIRRWPRSGGDSVRRAMGRSPRNRAIGKTGVIMALCYAASGRAESGLLATRGQNCCI